MKFIFDIEDNKDLELYCREFLGSELEDCLEMICRQFLDKCFEQISEIDEKARI